MSAVKSLKVATSAAVAPEIEWADYPRIAPGTYAAYSRVARRYYDKQYKRWVCLVRFDIFSSAMQRIATVPLFLNLGSQKKPRATRRGKFFQAWCEANGGPPNRTDRLSLAVFVRRMATIQVADTSGPAPYSVVRQVTSWDAGCGSISQSVSVSRKAAGKRPPATVSTESLTTETERWSEPGPRA